MSFYGCELSDLGTEEITAFCVAWRREASRMWSASPNAHCYLLHGIEYYVLILDELCHCMYNFNFLVYTVAPVLIQFCGVTTYKYIGSL